MNAAGDVRDNQIGPESAADSPTQAAEIYFHTGFPFDQVKLSSARRATIAARATIDQAGSRKGAGEGEPSRSEEQTSELQSLMRISYAVFCLKKKKIHKVKFKSERA